ncbi:MAG: zinc-dependent metalloprotease [Actinomycetota bacterium]|nr:zinc-dependent metalloprotease [Actinomycetota bacterium]
MPGLTAGDAAVDWVAAVRNGQRFAPSGPAVTTVQAARAVDDLRAYSRKAELIVRDTTGLGNGLPVAEADVVDRPHWIAATAEGMALLTAPLTDKLADKVTAPARAAAAAQIGMLLGLLSGKVLGQFDPLTTSSKFADTRTPPDFSAPGRLLLVAPNIMKVERELKVDHADFRMWVCLHESTHRLQFTAVPWLREYFVGQVGEFGDGADIDSSELLSRMVQAVKSRKQQGQSWIETIQTPEQRLVFDRLMALMSLLEGHADHVMDAVDQKVVPTVAAIRKAFTQRRSKGGGPVDRLVRSLLGMDMKMSQYIKGEAFVSQVVSRSGMDSFNTVWSSPETLPTRAEIADPDRWMARVL